MSRIANPGIDSLWAREFGEFVWFVPNPIGPYVFIIAIWFVDKAVALVSGELGMLTSIMAGVEILGLFLVVYATTTLAGAYNRATAEVTARCSRDSIEYAVGSRPDRLLKWIDQFALRLLNSKNDWEDRPAPPRLRRVFTLAGWTFHWIYLFVLSDSSFLIQQLGYPRYIVFMYFLVPVVYYPLFADLLAIIVNIHLGLLARIRDAGFYDIADTSYFGGLRSVGKTIELGTTTYVLGLVLYLFLTVLRGVRSGGTPADVAAAISVDVLYLLFGVVLGIVLMGYPILALHRHMWIHKSQYLRELSRDVSQVPGCDGWIPDPGALSDNGMQTYLMYYLKREATAQQREYPVMFTRVYSLGAALVLTPVINQLVTWYLPAVLEEQANFMNSTIGFGFII